jgi:hypothetical protein
MVYYLPNLGIEEDVPADWPTFWAQVELMLTYIRWDLEKDLQSRQEALNDAAGLQRDDVIRFRKSDDAEQIAYFHDLGRRTLDKVEDLIEARVWTPALAHHWSILMFAHGFVMPSAFAIDNDLSRERGGALVREKLSRERYRRWFAHYCLRAIDNGEDRRDADLKVELLVQRILAGQLEDLGDFNRDWFMPMVDATPDAKPEDWKSEADVPPLTARFRQKYLSVRQMRKLVLQPVDDIPPISLPLPRT